MKKLLGALIVVGVVVSCGPMNMLPDGGSAGGSAGGLSGVGGGSTAGGSAGGAMAGGSAGGATAGGTAGGATAGGSAGGATAGGSAGGAAGGTAGGSAAMVLFSTQVRPLLVNSCSGGSCHSVNDGNAHQFATGAPGRAPCNGSFTNRVAAGNATGSLLFQKLSGNHTCGGSRMPLNRAAFTQPQLGLIRDWINQGANNN
jgi:hypothetical protein